MAAPRTSIEFDEAYRAPITPWGDVRIPDEVRELAQNEAGGRVLELGCGVGRFSRFMARQGLQATGVDFSPVAIARARKRVAHDDAKPEFHVSDVTRLDALQAPFDVSFDVGCFHCLDAQGQQAYVSELGRLLKPGRTHMMWAIDSSPSGIPLSPEVMALIFASHFDLREARKSRRRIGHSHWYWLTRR